MRALKGQKGEDKEISAPVGITVTTDKGKILGMSNIFFLPHLCTVRAQHSAIKCYHICVSTNSFQSLSLKSEQRMVVFLWVKNIICVTFVALSLIKVEWNT